MRMQLFMIDAEIPLGSVAQERYWVSEARSIIKKWVVIVDEETPGGRHRFTVAGDPRRAANAGIEIKTAFGTSTWTTVLSRKVKLPWHRYKETCGGWRFAVDRFPNGGVDVQVGRWVWTNEWDAYLRKFESEEDGG